MGVLSVGDINSCIDIICSHLMSGDFTLVWSIVINRWNIKFIPPAGTPLAISDMTSNFIQITSPRERSRLRGRSRLLGGWISDVNRPRYRLVQVTCVTTINCGLAIRRLFVGLDWISWLNGPVGVV